MFKWKVTTICIFLCVAFVLSDAYAQQGESFSDHDPRWSPNGSQIVFYSNRAGNFDIYLVNADGTGLKQLTDDPTYEGSPAWSPDGKYITFSSNKGGERNIYIINTDGSELRRLTDEEGLNCSTHRWSPDGSRIAFEGRDPDKNTDIYVMNSDGTNIERLTTDPANDFAPVWGPDGKTIYFHSSRSGTYQIYRMNSDGSQTTLLTKGNNHKQLGSVSPDGGRIVYIADEQEYVQVSVMSSDGKETRQVTNTPTRKMRAEWSPDGQTILYSLITSDDGYISGQTYKINVNGTGRENFTEAIDQESD